MANKKLSKITQTHGAVEQTDGDYAPNSLDQIWGDKGIGKYKSLNVEEYQEYLSSLNKSDLQAHATTVGIIPSDNRDLMTRRLLKEFKLHVANYRKPKFAQRTPNEISDKALRILREGK